ncbi:RusA family crossover junction endodeoxyribonuclease [Haloimpatiens massiliensis]|uniref:RusA family crossover junction endodeoxyribonuclease n=1 Tax=Haloimpatiens massiliensis TaxID=1658110 RepID=UPI000C819BB2|nr:RusA family crossover junction endodeoxyribonuclease [Haloimpatiens massiliensis]
MICNYAKVIIKGSPITKSNFKLSNNRGRAILPYNSGKYHDRYALYEQQIAYEARCQNPNTVLNESLIAILKVYYKSKKRHPDTTNITKSIFDGIEKSGLIINDAQIRRLIIEEFYDKDNPRFELELFPESEYSMEYSVFKKEEAEKPIIYSPPANKKNKLISCQCNKKKISDNPSNEFCEICGKPIKTQEGLSINKGSSFICNNCFKKLF